MLCCAVLCWVVLCCVELYSRSHLLQLRLIQHPLIATQKFFPGQGPSYFLLFSSRLLQPPLIATMIFGPQRRHKPLIATRPKPKLHAGFMERDWIFLERSRLMQHTVAICFHFRFSLRAAGGGGRENSFITAHVLLAVMEATGRKRRDWPEEKSRHYKLRREPSFQDTK